jgi:hypothetical protein
MDEVRLAKTASRSVIGIMNEFTYLAEAWRQDEPDLLALAVRLAATPCGSSVQTAHQPRSRTRHSHRC